MQKTKTTEKSVVFFALIRQVTIRRLRIFGLCDTVRTKNREVLLWSRRNLVPLYRPAEKIWA